MAVSLVKGGNVSLTKEKPPALTTVTVGLGWDVRKTDGQAFDLDASAFVLGQNEKVLRDGYFVFFNNKSSPEGAVTYGGEHHGEGEGDDETIKVDFEKLPQEGRE